MVCPGLASNSPHIWSRHVLEIQLEDAADEAVMQTLSGIRVRSSCGPCVSHVMRRSRDTWCVSKLCNTLSTFTLMLDVLEKSGGYLLRILCRGESSSIIELCEWSLPVTRPIGNTHELGRSALNRKTRKG